MIGLIVEEFREGRKLGAAAERERIDMTSKLPEEGGGSVIEREAMALTVQQVGAKDLESGEWWFGYSAVYNHNLMALRRGLELALEIASNVARSDNAIFNRYNGAAATASRISQLLKDDPSQK